MGAMETPIEQKYRDTLFFIMQIVLFVLLAGVHPVITWIMTGDDGLSGGSLQIIYTADIITGMLQLLLSLELVVFEQQTGFIAQVVLNLVNVAFIVLMALAWHSYFGLSGVVISMVTILVCSIIHAQLAQFRHNERDLYKLAYTDTLTGLPNRNAQLRAIESYINGEQRIPMFTLILFDYDNFKMINEFLGHQIGDIFLIESVHHLRGFVGGNASLGRVGDDRFLLLLPGAKSEDDVLRFIEGLQREIASPFYYKGHDYQMTACFGVVRYPKDSTNADGLMRQVEIALFRAKSHGKNRIVFFDERMQQTLERQMTLENKLFAAIDKGELYLEYQPQYHIPDRTLRGFEVLVRWESAELGHIAPLDFIPLAEANGTIVAIGKWILHEACTEFSRIRTLYEESPLLAINISVVQFSDPDFMTMVRSTIAETGIDPACLEFEITESVFIKSQERARHILDELKALGIRISLDDFGTGYSSLSYLRQLPFDIVKIDKSFIDPIGTFPDEKNIVRSIIDMAHQLGLEVVAEGIERQEQFDYLARTGCDFIQGNYIGRPVVISAL